MRISVGQFGPVGDVEENLAVMARLAARAAGEGADLLVPPEEAMLGAREVGEEFPDAVAAAWEPFAAGLAALAREHGIAVVAGGYEPGPDRRPYNTLLAVGADGARLGAYRKLHLYDAFAHRESDRITPGDGGIAAIELGLRRMFPGRGSFPFSVAEFSAATAFCLIGIGLTWRVANARLLRWTYTVYLAACVAAFAIASPMRSSTRRSRTRRSGGWSARICSIQTCPRLSMNAARMRIVTNANSELTIPRPMLPSTTAASSIRSGSLRACSSSLSMTW